MHRYEYFITQLCTVHFITMYIKNNIVPLRHTCEHSVYEMFCTSGTQKAVIFQACDWSVLKCPAASLQICGGQSAASVSLSSELLCSLSSSVYSGVSNQQGFSRTAAVLRQALLRNIKETTVGSERQGLF